jgi:hypothetical protein
MDPIERNRLLEALLQNFDKRELRTLCFELGVDIENFGEARSDIVIGLIGYCERHGMVDELKSRLAQSETRPSPVDNTPSSGGMTIIVNGDLKVEGDIVGRDKKVAGGQ